MDSIPIFLSELKYQIIYETGSFFFEILIVFPLYLFASFLQFACETLIIFHLNPNYILISDSIYFEIKHILEKIFPEKNDDNTYYFIIQFIAEMCALLGYIIFLEIIILNFCGLNKDIKENIILRGERDSKVKELSLEPLTDEEKEDSEDDNDNDNDINDNEDNNNKEM